MMFEMPEKYYDADAKFDIRNIPLWAKNDQHLWMPLIHKKNAKRFFTKFRVGVYRFDIQKKIWSFELGPFDEDHIAYGVWEANPDTNNFHYEPINNTDMFYVDDVYYCYADDEHNLVAAIFTFATDVDNEWIDTQWQEFENGCLKPMMVVASWETPKPLIFNNQSSNRLVRFMDKHVQKNPNWKGCVEAIYMLLKKRLDYALISHQLNDIYMLIGSKDGEWELLAYALVKVVDEKLCTKRVELHILESCKPIYAPAHELLVGLKTHFCLPTFPPEIVDEKNNWHPHWIKHVDFIIEQAIECAGWRFLPIMFTCTHGMFEVFPCLFFPHPAVKKHGEYYIQASSKDEVKKQNS